MKKMLLVFVVMFFTGTIITGCDFPTTSKKLEPTPTSTSTTEKPIFRIGIQPGHWKKDPRQYDPGALSCDGKVKEVDINVAVANKTADILKQRGYQVDVLEGTIEAVHNKSFNAFVSLHVDQCKGNNTGFKISRWQGKKGGENAGLIGTLTNPADASDRLVINLWKSYERATRLSKNQNPGHYDAPCFVEYYAFNPVEGGPICEGEYKNRPRGISDDTPGAIIEIGWLSGDLAFMASPDGQEKMAQGIADGIENFLQGIAFPTLTVVIPTPTSTSMPTPTATATATPIPLSTPTSTPFSSVGKLAYEDKGGIWTITEDGRDKQLLITKGREPRWSPDVRRIAYISDWLQIRTVNYDGSGDQELFDAGSLERTGTQIQQFRWSHDGNRIFYLFWPGDTILHYVDISTSKKGKLPLGVFTTDFDIARGNGEIVFETGESTVTKEVEKGQDKYGFFTLVCIRTERTLIVADNQGKNKRKAFVDTAEYCNYRLPRLAGRDPAHYQWSYPVFSPDGKKIAFLNKGKLFIIDIDGQNLKALTQATMSKIAWSPDGKKIAFLRNYQLKEPPYARNEIWVINSDGRSEPKKLVEGSNPFWAFAPATMAGFTGLYPPRILGWFLFRPQAASWLKV